MTKHDDIQVLNDRQKARDRLPIWFGSRDNYYHPIKEVIANATDEVMNNFSTGTITIELGTDNQTISVTDTGRGIPFWEKTDGVPNYELLFTTLFAGTKYETTGDTTTGTNGVGNTVTNYTSKVFKCISVYGGYEHTIEYNNGGDLVNKKRTKTDKPSGTTIVFKLDPDVYTSTIFTPEKVRDIVESFAIASANKNIRFIYKYGEKEEELKFSSIKDYFNLQIGNQSTSTTIHFPEEMYKNKGEETGIELMFTTTPEQIQKTFLNLTHLEEGGSIHNGVIYGIREYCTDYCIKNKLFKGKVDRFMPTDIENSVSFIANVFSNNVEFKNQTKLSTDKQLYRDVALEQTKRMLAFFEQSDKKNFDKFIKHLLTVQSNNAANQRATNRLKKELTKNIESINHRVEKLTDCKNHGLESELFITEGDSAKGSVIAARDSSYQASYPLRGKILNCLKASPTQMFNSGVILDLIKALGCGAESKNKDLDTFNKDKLRYGKIIILADSDADGQQIANLVIVALYKLVPTLVRDGHVYIAKAPLYKVIKEDNKILFYFSEDEKNKKLPKVKGKYTISRLKGLGEIDSDTMAYTAMNSETRELVRVNVEDVNDFESKLDIWMGDGLDDRKEFISYNLNKYLDDIE